MQFMLFFFGLLLILLGLVTCYLGKIKAVNWVIGFRIAPTMRDPEIWKVVNIHTGIITSVHGVITTIIGLTLPKVDLSIVFAVMILPLFIQMFYGIWYAYRLEKRKMKEGKPITVLPLPKLRFSLLLVGLLLIGIGCGTYYVGEVRAVNSFWGVRVPPTLEDPEVWRIVNIQTGFLTVLHGASIMAVGLIVSKVKISGIILLLILVLPLVAYLSYGVWYAYQL